MAYDMDPRLLVPLGTGAVGELTTRTDADTGELTMATANHGISTGDTVNLTWDGGSRSDVTVGNVSGTTVPIDGGTGTDLPATSTDITVTSTACTPYTNFCCGAPLTLYSPDYVWDACPGNFTTYNDGLLRVQTWYSRVGSLNLEEDTGVTGADAPYYREPESPPSLVTAGHIGSIECVQFADDYLVTPNFPSQWTQPFTIGMVVKWNGTTGGVQWTICDGNNSTNRAVIFLSTTNVISYFAGSTVLGSVSPVNNDINKIVVCFDGVNSYINVDETIDTGDPGSGALDGFSLGQRQTTLGGTAYWGGVMAECALWNKALTQSESNAVIDWWDTKWTSSITRP